MATPAGYHTSRNDPPPPVDVADTVGDTFTALEPSTASDLAHVVQDANRPGQQAKGKQLITGVMLGLLLQSGAFWNKRRLQAFRALKRVMDSLGISWVVKRLVKYVNGVRALSKSNKLVTGTVLIGAVYWYNKSRRKKTKTKARKVAVIGSGVAGSGAAWSLNRSGIEAVLYEKKPKLGGNAKSMTWDVDGKKVDTGLAVLAWPGDFFHNYNALVEKLDIETEYHDLKFFVGERSNDSVECVFAHGREGWKPDIWLEEDLGKWERLYRFVKRVNAVLQPSTSPSLYRMNFLNPLNMIPLRLLCRFFGVSDRFWNFVFVPIHTSTFIEVEMDTLPAAMAEILNEIVPFARTPHMRTWKSTAYDTILKMTQDLPKANIRTSCAVETVQYIPSQSIPGKFDVKVIDEDGSEQVFDGVIFACSAQAMNRILHGKGEVFPGQPPLISNGANGLNNNLRLSGLRSWLLNWMETNILSTTLYTTDRDTTFEKGVAHSKPHAVLPEKYQKEIMNAYCNYIEVESSNPREIENSFVISSWAPTTQTPDVKGKRPMLVTYNADKKLENEETEWISTSKEAHPCLTTWQMICSVILWPFLQGARNEQTYFCGSAVLPGNGHDLSFLSGLVAADEFGADYPFEDNENAKADYLRLRQMMLSIWA